MFPLFFSRNHPAQAGSLECNTYPSFQERSTWPRQKPISGFCSLEVATHTGMGPVPLLLVPKLRRCDVWGPVSYLWSRGRAQPGWEWSRQGWEGNWEVGTRKPGSGDTIWAPIGSNYKCSLYFKDMCQYIPFWLTHLWVRSSVPDTNP